MNKLKNIIIGGAVLFFIGALSSGSTSTDVQGAKTEPTIAVVTNMPTATITATHDASGLSNDDYYTNSAGNEVHSPAYSDAVPAGASAQCEDGTYSFSQSRRGTCSHHGGVAVWL